MTYRLRLVITIALLIALSFSIGGTILIAVSFQISLKAETRTALEAYETVQNTLYLLNQRRIKTDYEGLGEALEQMAEQELGRWQALTLSAEDEVIYQSGQEALAGYAMPLPQGDRCSTMLVSDDYGPGLLVLSSIESSQESLTLGARFDLSQVYAARQTQQRLYSLVYLAVMLLGVAAAFILSNTLTGPLRRLTAAVRQISGGDLSIRSGIDTPDEFGQLSRDFDAMADKLQENISRLETDMQRQESFMGAFAHELKTPMTSIIGFADLLRQGNLDENTRMMSADYIFSEGHRLEQLSFKLLELLLLKKDSVTMKRVNLAVFLSEVEKAMSPKLKERGIRLICRADAQRAAFEPDLVKSLIYNLIDNAAKAMEGEGIIAVKGSAIPGGCQFQVADNGRGMEKAELTKITEAFYRVDKARSRQQGGAGLGLALCKQIVELHNGSISFVSEPGTGTRVTVTLYGKEEKK